MLINSVIKFLLIKNIKELQVRGTCPGKTMKPCPRIYVDWTGSFNDESAAKF